MIDYMYACKGSINYINASTFSVYVVAYNMYTEIYVCYSETQNEKGTKWQKKRKYTISAVAEKCGVSLPRQETF